MCSASRSFRTAVGILAFFTLILLLSTLMTLQVYQSDTECPLAGQERGVQATINKSLFGGSKSKGIKFRSIKTLDLPPETKPGWNPKSQTPTPRFPKCLILGFGKCGTSALVTFLPLHPEIVTIDWEIDYFCDRVYFKYDLHWYRMRMPPSTSEQITVEKSPCYINDPRAPDRIKAFNSSIRLIITVRNPIDRILSRQSQVEAGSVTFGVPTKSLEESITRHNGDLNEPVVQSWGVYADKVKRVYSLFPEEQILVVDGDLLVKDPLSQLRRIETFLGIKQYFSDKDLYFDEDKGFFCYRHRNTTVSKCLGSNKGRPHSEIDPELRSRLQDYLRPYNEQFFQIVGQRFDWD